FLAKVYDAKPSLVYHISYFNINTGDFGGNITVSATPNWFLRFTFPSPTTYIKRISGPVAINRYPEGAYFVSLLQGVKDKTVTVNFKALCTKLPLSWDEMLLISPTLYMGQSVYTANQLHFTKDVDFFVTKPRSLLQTKPYEELFPTKPQLASLKIDNSEPQIDLSPSDQTSLEADGTYLVGTQVSLIVCSAVIFIGALSYAYGSIVRLRLRKRFRSEKLRRSRIVRGYSQII
ncbi:hypothetical protein L0F63_007220, partial [Massospora cicadina]